MLFRFCNTKLPVPYFINPGVHQDFYVCCINFLYQQDFFCAVRHYRFVGLIGVRASAPLGAALRVTPLAQSSVV
jgi:hypothetical protein